MRRLPALIPVAVIALATTGATVAPTGRAAPLPVTGLDFRVVARGPARCPGDDLRLQRVASAVGTGNIALALGFRNASREACSLEGWPAVTPITVHGHRGRVRRVKNTPIGFEHAQNRTVVLKPGALDDAFVIGGTDDPLNGRSCGPSYRKVEVGLPGYSSRFSSSAFIPSYGRYMPACTTLGITPIQRRSDLIFGERAH